MQRSELERALPREPSSVAVEGPVLVLLSVAPLARWHPDAVGEQASQRHGEIDIEVHPAG